VADAELEPRGERRRVHRQDLATGGQVLRRAEQFTIDGERAAAQARDAAFAEHSIESGEIGTMA
jgi:hypothetical protein